MLIRSDSLTTSDFAGKTWGEVARNVAYKIDKARSANILLMKATC